METINIKRASNSDLADLQKIGIQTFRETFSENNIKEDMDKYLEETFNKDVLTKELAEPNSQFYLAFNTGAVIGYLKINFGAAQTEMKDKNSLEIERIYVRKDYLGRSVGQLLYNKALDIAREKKNKLLWLGVWEKNTRAINFYKKNGLVEFDTHIFKLGNDLQTDVLMRIEF